MSDWGEEIEAEEPTPEKTQESNALEGIDVVAASGVDVEALVQEMAPMAVRGTVEKTIAKTVSDAVSEAIENSFDEDTLNALRERTLAALPQALEEEPAEEEEEENGGLVYASLDEFVREFICVIYSRRVGGTGSGRVWRARWWDSAEAVIRLEALWRSWAYFRKDPATGISVWLKDHADHHMAVLMDPDGPFGGEQADEDQCRYGEPLPHIDPPDGMFERFDDES